MGTARRQQGEDEHNIEIPERGARDDRFSSFPWRAEHAPLAPPLVASEEPK